MEHHEFHHLGRDWEAVILAPKGDEAQVRFRSADDSDSRTYEGSIDCEELEDADAAGKELALRRGLESALVLRVLSGRADGLTLEDVAERTGMPPEAAADRMHALDSVQPVVSPTGTRRYRLAGSDTD